MNPYDPPSALPIVEAVPMKQRWKRAAFLLGSVMAIGGVILLAVMGIVAIVAESINNPWMVVGNVAALLGIVSFFSLAGFLVNWSDQ